MRKSPSFLECRAVIGQQHVYTTNLWYLIHAIDICSYTPKYADQLTLKQMRDQQITYLSSNQLRTHTVRSAFYVVSQSTSQGTSKRVRIYHLPFFCRHCRDVRSDVCHGSTISSISQETKPHQKSWPTLSIVWLLLYSDSSISCFGMLFTF